MPFLFSSNFYCNPKLIQIDTRMKLIIAICLLAVAVLGNPIQNDPDVVLSRWTQIRDRMENGLADAAVKKLADSLFGGHRSKRSIEEDPDVVLSRFTEIRDKIEDGVADAIVKKLGDLINGNIILSRWTEIRDRIEDGLADAAIKKLSDIINNSNIQLNSWEQLQSAMDRQFKQWGINRAKRSIESESDVTSGEELSAAQKMQILSWWTKVRDTVEDIAAAKAIEAAAGAIVG